MYLRAVTDFTLLAQFLENEDDVNHGNESHYYERG